MLCGRMDVHCMICISGKVAIQNHGDFIKKKGAYIQTKTVITDIRNPLFLLTYIYLNESIMFVLL